MTTKTKKPSEQRKKLYDAPPHRRGRLLSAHLSSELRGTHNARSVPVRTGDNIRVLRGDYKGFEGKILRVDRGGYKIFVDGINREKADGTSILVPIHPSKVEVIRLNLDDKWRGKILKRKGPIEKGETLMEKPVEKAEEVKPPEELPEKTAKVEEGK